MNSRVTKNHSGKSVIKDIKYSCIDTNQEGFANESWTKSQFNLGFPMAVVNECFDKKILNLSVITPFLQILLVHALSEWTGQSTAGCRIATVFCGIRISIFMCFMTTTCLLMLPWLVFSVRSCNFLILWSCLGSHSPFRIFLYYFSKNSTFLIEWWHFWGWERDPTSEF